MNAVTRADVFGTFRPWLDESGYTTDRIAVVNALCAWLGLPEDQPVAASSTDYDRAAMREELVRDEGERLRVYRCTERKLTIGVGRNLDDVGIFAHETRALGITRSSCIANGITREQSRALLDSDIDRVEKDLDRRLPWWRKLDPLRQRVMINMAFNLGIGGFCGFKNTLAMIARGDFAGAATNMLLSKWARQVGNRALRLSAMMRKGTI